VAEPDGVPQEAWIRLGAVQEIVRTPNRNYFTATHSGMVVGDLALGDQSVTDTHVRLDIARMRGIGLDLLA